jgi:hypothetical protein
MGRSLLRFREKKEIGIKNRNCCCGDQISTHRNENGRKRSVNTKTVAVFIFLSKTESVTPEMETMSVFRKLKFGTENISITVEI